MSQIAGNVTRVSEKDWQGTMLYSFQIDSDGRWFRTGRVKPLFETGQPIQFTVSDDGKNTVNLATVAAVTGVQQSPTASTVVNAAPPQQAVGNKSNYWDAKDKYDKEVRQPAIEFQSARNAAISFVNVLLSHDALPGVSKSAASGKRLEVIEATVEQYTEQFFAALPHKMGNPDELNA